MSYQMNGTKKEDKNPVIGNDSFRRTKCLVGGFPSLRGLSFRHSKGPGPGSPEGVPFPDWPGARSSAIAAYQTALFPTTEA